ncbi:four helix bundle protein [Fidelibacter multiformis]|uniref:four helix bundle protein n=1 Tax=Fidelibacter multiformis TaxID=3377529 RepID=UPI0037DC2B50
MRFEEIEVWKEARMLSQKIFQLTQNNSFKKDLRFRDQIRSSSGSIMDNIAEGYERGGNKEFIQFLYIAKGSCGETRSQIHRAFDFQYIDQQEYENILKQCVSLSIKISNFITYIYRSKLKGDKYVKK